MLRHVLNTLSDGQAVTATARSTNTIDFGSAGIGNGEAIDLEVTVGTSFAGLTSVQFAFQDSADGVTFADVFTSRVFPLAELSNTGKPVLRIPLPSLPEVRRYGAVNYVVVGTGTAGTFNAAILNTRR